MNLRVLLEGWLKQVPDVAIRGIEQDSARVEEDYVYVALRNGKRHDPAALGQAVERGCAAVLHDGAVRLPAAGVPAIAVPRLDERLGELASRFWAAPSDLITVAGVSGVSGRASVAHYLAQVWQRSCGAGGVIARCGHGPVETLRPVDQAVTDVFRLNAALAACVDNGVERVAVEVSPNALEQGRCQTLQIDLAIITGLAPGSSGACPERRLFTEFAPRFAVVNHDDPVGCELIGRYEDSAQILGYGLNPKAELTAAIASMEPESMVLHFDGPWGQARVQTELSGEAEARNLLAVAGTLVLLGLDWNEACRQLELIRPVPVRARSTGMIEGRRVSWEKAA